MDADDMIGDREGAAERGGKLGEPAREGFPFAAAAAAQGSRQPGQPAQGSPAKSGIG